MTEFHFNLNKEQVENLIKQKMKMYGEDFEYMRFDNVEIKETNFIFQSYCKYYNLDYKYVKINRYLGVSDGIEMYHFYVIKFIV